MRVGSLGYIRMVHRMMSSFLQGVLIGVGVSEAMNNEPESV